MNDTPSPVPDNVYRTRLLSSSPDGQKTRSRSAKQRRQTLGMAEAVRRTSRYTQDQAVTANGACHFVCTLCVPCVCFGCALCVLCVLCVVCMCSVCTAGISRFSLAHVLQQNGATARVWFLWGFAPPPHLHPHPFPVRLRLPLPPFLRPSPP